MAQPQQAPFPQEVEIGPNWQIVFDAIDPTSGASVGGVTVTDCNLTATSVTTGLPVTLTPGPYMLVGGPNA